MSARAHTGALGQASPHRRPDTAQPHLAVGLVLLAALGALVAALVLAPRTASEPTGAVTAATISHDFGEVRIGDGLVLTRFPLEIVGTPLVSILGST